MCVVNHCRNTVDVILRLSTLFESKECFGAQANAAGFESDAQCTVNVNDVFRDMDEQQWRYFTMVMTEQIDDALRDGRWKGTQQASARGATVGMSCP